MNWTELPSKLKTYIVIVAIIALPIMAWALLDTSTKPPDIGWIVLAALVILTVPFHVLLDSANATINVGDSYILAIGMMYGVSPCIIATFCHTFLVSYFARRPKIHSYQIIFNVSSTICAAYIYSSIYKLALPREHHTASIILCSAIVSLIYFISNSCLVSLAIAWSIRENFLRFWARMCMPLAVELSISASVATIIVVLENNYKNYSSLLVSPIIGLLWGYHALNKSRIVSNQSRITEAERHLKEQEQLYLRTVESLALAVDAKDQTTYGHIRRVRVYAVELAKLCGITDPDEFRAIETGSLLHDIGKLAIDDYILNKPGKLTTQEFEKIKLHAAAGDEILQQVRFPFPVAKYVRNHHERWDGNGYPDGLKGEEIPLGARILSVADAFDAIRFSRPYKLAMSTDEAIETVCSQSGTFFDPKLVQLLKDNIKALDQIALLEAENAPELSFRKYFEMVDQSSLKPALVAENTRDIPVEIVQLAEFCSTMGGFFDLKDILPTLLLRIEHLVPFNTCALYLDDNGVHLKTACAVGKFADILQTHTIEMGRGISGWVAAYRRPMLNTGPALDFRNIQGDFTSLSDTLAVPILHNEGTLGTLTFYAQRASTYTQEHLQNLQMLAGLIAPWIAEYKKRDNTSIAQDIVDPTTKIRRVSYLAAIGPQLISAAGISRSPLSLIYLDIRNLAQIHRIYGGDLCNFMLRRIADCIQPELRETDILVRYGTQGFIAFLPGVRDEQAIRCAQRLRQQIKREIATITPSVTIDCKTSVAVYPKDGATVITLLQSAQEALKQSLGSENLPFDHNVVDFFPRI
jgi:diguanylate cyclase (GGDEF)-like protein/putative nucleotidyltransferase with HDIG domain